MALPADILKIRPWASAAPSNRQDPAEVGIDRAQGWPVAYEQLGGLFPERTVFNQVLYELTAWATYQLAAGVPEWDAGIDYVHPAFVTHAGDIWRSSRNTGPATGDATDPSSADQDVWELY